MGPQIQTTNIPTTEGGALLRLGELENTEVAELNRAQQALEPHVDSIAFIWWVVWAAALGYVCFKYVLKPSFEKLVASKNEE